MADTSGVTPGLDDAHSALPLCVDLDGTLLRTDTLHEACVAAVAADPRIMLALPGWLRRGKAHLKQELAARWAFDPAALPYNQDALQTIRAARASGRRIVLCTAADRSIADRIALHLGLFDEVLASDGVTNLRGEAKAAALVARFGAAGFTYMGNDASDLPIWAKAGAAILVGVPPRLRDALGATRIEQVIATTAGRLRAMVRALRPYQWSKNLLCLAPVLASGTTDPHAWAMACLTLAAFCATASGVYLLNDLTDLAADRAHATKSRRPFASGAVPLLWGVAAAPLLLLLGAGLGVAAGALPLLAVYAAMSLAYTWRLKELPLLDVFLLAALYTLRVLAGGVAAGHHASPWLLGFSGFLFLSLGLLKRVSELKRLEDTAQTEPARRGYQLGDRALLQQFGAASSFASAVVLSIYVQSEAALRIYPAPELLWPAVPLLLLWQCRLWLAASRGTMHDDPIVFAARDASSWLVALCLLLLGLWSHGYATP